MIKCIHIDAENSAEPQTQLLKPPGAVIFSFGIETVSNLRRLVIFYTAIMLIHAYTARWQMDFERLKQVLQKPFVELSVVIEHLGSTAVPGSCKTNN